MRRLRTRARGVLPAVVVLALSVAGARSGSQPPATRYRVEQVFRLETTSAQRTPGRAEPELLTTAVEGRVRLVLEQRREDGAGTWRFAEVEVDGPRPEPPGSASPATEHAVALGLDWMRSLAGQEFRGPPAQLPVLPLGEASPAWLTEWLRWAQTGSFAEVPADPAGLARLGGLVPAEAATPDPERGASYQVRWLRSEFRQEPCHVQQARWALPVQAAPGSVTPDLAAEGVEARTHFAASSLEWVTQQNPVLIYAERSGVRETFWNLEKVKKPELRGLVFRLRLAVQVRLERLQ